MDPSGPEPITPEPSVPGPPAPEPTAPEATAAENTVDLLARYLAEPRMGSFINVVIACSLGFGGSALFLGLAAMEAPSSWWTRGWCPRLLAIQFALTGVGLVTVLRGRWRFRRLAPATRAALAIVGWAIVLLLSIAILVTFKE